MVRFMVLGDPKGKERPKFARRGRFVHTYTPKQTVDYERRVKESYVEECGDYCLEGPIEARITGIFKVPKSVSKKKRQELIGDYYLSKPDADNIGKVVLDPLNTVAFEDDKQVCDLSVTKYYGEIPRVVVELEEIRKKPKGGCINPLHFYDENGNEVDELFRRKG